MSIRSIGYGALGCFSRPQPPAGECHDIAPHQSTLPSGIRSRLARPERPDPPLNYHRRPQRLPEIGQFLSIDFLRGVHAWVAVCACAALLTSSSVAAGEDVSPSYRVHLIAKPAVVRIFAGYSAKIDLQGKSFETASISSGSGFLVSPDGYIMTNAHVVSSSRESDDEFQAQVLLQIVDSYLKTNHESTTPQNRGIVLQKLKDAGIRIQISRVNRVAFQDKTTLPFEIKAYGAPIGESTGALNGKDIAIIKVETSSAPTLQLGDSSRAKVGDRVYVIGYPGAADSEALDPSSELEPTTNDGSISAVKKSVDGIPILQTNASSTHGNSGGPVLNEAGEVIGLLTFRGNAVNNQEVQGFNFIVASNTAREYLRQAAVDTKPGLVDERWRTGLGYYWEGRYQKAKEMFEQVRALNPKHSEAERLISESQMHILHGDETFSILGLRSGGIAALGGAAAIGAAASIVLIRRRVRKTSRGAVSRAMINGGSHEATQVVPTPRTINSVATSRATASSLQMTFLSGPLANQAFGIPESGFTVGRDPMRAQVVVADSMISGAHLWIGQSKGQWVLRDEGSTNGTFLGSTAGPRVKHHTIQGGEEFVLGEGGTVAFRLTLQ